MREIIIHWYSTNVSMYLENNFGLTAHQQKYAFCAVFTWTYIWVLLIKYLLVTKVVIWKSSTEKLFQGIASKAVYIINILITSFSTDFLKIVCRCWPRSCVFLKPPLSHWLWKTVFQYRHLKTVFTSKTRFKYWRKLSLSIDFWDHFFSIDF